MKRLKNGTLKNSTGTHVIKPDGTAYSYGWYKLGEFISPNLYMINNFRYSNTTMRHRSNTFRALKYPTHIDVYAPKGLDDVEATKSEMLSMIARLREKQKKARRADTLASYYEQEATLANALNKYLNFKDSQKEGIK